MTCVELPRHRLKPGKPVPFNIWDGRANLLIREGGRVLSAQHQQILAAHKACVTETDFKAWQRSYDRMVYKLFLESATMEQRAKSYMPSKILDVDYVMGYGISGGWLDLQEVLSDVFCQGPAARTPLERLEGTQCRATELVADNPDDILFTLFQTMPDSGLGHCAKHALLAAALCKQTARKLQVADLVRPVQFRAALTMSIGMARQTTGPSPEQQRLIQEHPQLGADILRGFGVVDEYWLALVAGTSLRIGSAMTTAVGFYPPGTYVALSNGETAVVVRRGETASAPLVVSILNAAGLALAQYVARDTREKSFFILVPVSAERLKFTISNDKVQHALGRVPGNA